MKMTLGTGSISNYESVIKGKTLNQFPFKIPVNSLTDVQLYIDLESTSPGSASYQLIHTCGATIGAVDSVSPGAYVIGQDSNDNYYGVFREFSGSSARCFVIAISIGGNIYFSEEYEIACTNSTLIQGCYGNLDPLISYDCNGQYFGISQGGTSGDADLHFEHQLLLRDVDVKISAIKNTFKQGLTRTFRTVKEKIFQFFAEPIPEWYLEEIDGVFTRGEVFVGGVKYLVSDTPYELIDDTCMRTWKPTVFLKENCAVSFSCEADPCGPPVVVPGGGGNGGGNGSGEESGPPPSVYDINLIGSCVGIESSYLISGGTAADIVTVRAEFSGILQKNINNFVMACLAFTTPDGTEDVQICSTCYTDTAIHGFTLIRDVVITMPGTTATCIMSARIQNGSTSPTGVSVTIIDINGTPASISTSGCRGNEGVGGTC